jgi:hypothetical protein
VFGENVAQAEQVAGLLGVRLVADDRGQGGDGASVIAAAVLNQPNVQANAGHFGFEFFGFLEKSESVVPLFAPHGDDAEIGVGRTGLRVDREDAPEGGFGGGQIAGLEGSLALREGGLGVDDGCAASAIRGGLLGAGMRGAS